MSPKMDASIQTLIAFLTFTPKLKSKQHAESHRASNKKYISFKVQIFLCGLKSVKIVLMGLIPNWVNGNWCKCKNSHNIKTFNLQFLTSKYWFNVQIIFQADIRTKHQIPPLYSKRNKIRNLKCFPRNSTLMTSPVHSISCTNKWLDFPTSISKLASFPKQ